RPAGPRHRRRLSGAAVRGPSHRGRLGGGVHAAERADAEGAGQPGVPGEGDDRQPGRTSEAGDARGRRDRDGVIGRFSVERSERLEDLLKQASGLLDEAATVIRDLGIAPHQNIRSIGEALEMIAGVRNAIYQKYPDVKPDVPGESTEASQLGDLHPELFRMYANQVVDWITVYLADPERFPVLARVKPGDVRHALPAAAPEEPEPLDRMLADFERVILPGVTHWNHPGFFAYFSISGSAPRVLGELLCAALNVNAMLWRTSPAATELEEVVLDWLRKLLGLPASFHGVIYDTASISTLCALAAAREAAGHELREQGMTGRASVPRLRVY